MLSGRVTDGESEQDAVTRLEERLAELLGKPAAAMFPSGTMAQQVALRYWARDTGNLVVAMHPLSHPEVHERKAYSVLSGLSAVWPTTEHRQLTAADVAAVAEPFGTLLVEPVSYTHLTLPTIYSV